MRITGHGHGATLCFYGCKSRGTGTVQLVRGRLVSKNGAAKKADSDGKLAAGPCALPVLGASENGHTQADSHPLIRVPPTRRRSRANTVTLARRRQSWEEERERERAKAKGEGEGEGKIEGEGKGEWERG